MTNHDDVTGRSLAPNPSVQWTWSGDQVVLVHLEDNAYYVLNGTAALLWEGLVEEGRLGPAIEDIAEGLAVGREQVVDDARSFVREMLDNGLVESGERLDVEKSA